MSTLEKIRAKIQKVLDTERDFTSENAKAQALALVWVLELFDKYAEQEQTTRQSCENCKQEPKECGNDAHYGFCQNWEYAEQEPCEVSEYDKDHIWYKGRQYISLRRFLEVKAEAEQEPKTGQFAEWVAREIFDDMWEYNKDAFAEVACRKLAKLGLVKEDGDEWVLVGKGEQNDKDI